MTILYSPVTDSVDGSGTMFSVANLLNLQEFWINQNSISGHVDDEYSTLTSLSDIFFHTNSISGTAVETLVQLPAAKYVNMFDNRLSGTLPEFELVTRTPTYRVLKYLLLNK